MRIISSSNETGTGQGRPSGSPATPASIAVSTPSPPCRVMANLVQLIAARGPPGTATRSARPCSSPKGSVCGNDGAGPSRPSALRTAHEVDDDHPAAQWGDLVTDDEYRAVTQ